MKIIDISDPLCQDMIGYPSIKPFAQQRLRDYSKGDAVCLSAIEMVVHSGTHLDAPRHYIEGGPGIDQVPLQRFIGEAQVIEVDNPVITAKVLKTRNIDKGIVLFKTPFSENIRENRAGEASYLTADAAEYLVEKGIEMAGIDSFSVDKERDKEKPAHKILLKAGVLLLEGICLEGVFPGVYQLICFPLRIKDIEAAPCRAILLDEGEGT